MISRDDIHGAAELLAGRVRETPLLPAGELSRRLGARVLLKAENVQLTGSFKPRGALNAVLRLPPERLEAGVAAASAGNHAQALAYAAREAGTRATVFMPAGAPVAKVAAVRGYGAEVRLIEGSYDDAGQAALAAADEEGKALVHAFDDADVVAGQATVGVEIARAAPEVSLAVVPLGGGGLASGVAMALKDVAPDARVVGVQAEGCAPYSAGGLVGTRTPTTICDGIAIKEPGEFTKPLVERWVDDVVTVSDDQVAEAMVLLLERSKQVVEGAGAVGVAALMAGKLSAPSSGDVVIVLSGGNVDATLLAECIRMGETSAGRRMVLATVVPDRPGALASLLGVVAENGANIVEVEHLREGVDLHLRETAIHLTLQTRGPEHGRELLETVRSHGFTVRVEHEA